MGSVGRERAPDNALVLPDAVGHWKRLVGAGVVGVAFFGMCAIVVPGVVKLLALLLVAAGTGALIVATARLVRSGPQLRADADGVCIKVWRGYRCIGWTDVTRIEPVRSASGYRNTVALPAGRQIDRVPSWMHESLGGDDQQFTIRCGRWTPGGLQVHEVDDGDLDDVRARLVTWWLAANARTMPR